MILTSDEAVRALLTRSTTVAMIGASPHPARPSAGVFAALRRHGRFDVTPINPAIEAIDGVRAFPTLAAYSAERGAPDIVDVFRNPADAPTVARAAIDVGAKAIWFQFGVRNDDAIAMADAAGLDVVVERCLKIDAGRLLR